MGKKLYHPLRKVIDPANATGPKKSTINPKIPLALAHFAGNTAQLKATAELLNLDADDFYSFVGSLQGHLVSSLCNSYDVSRSDADPAFDKYPNLVVYCNDASDVINCINYAVAQFPPIPLSTRAGGHSTAGYSVGDHTLVIDVSSIKGIFIDTDTMISTVGAGVRWGEYNHALNAYGLHNPGGSCSDVGLTGFTLGGGYGYTSVKWGIACDSLLEVVVVTSRGEIVVANANQNPDLLWAHQGGTGGNFGVVVALKYQLYNLKYVWRLSINWPIDDAAKVLTFWQDNMTRTLQDLDIGIQGFLAFDTNSQPYFALRGMYLGQTSDETMPAISQLDAMLAIPGTHPKFQPIHGQKATYAAANDGLLDDFDGMIPKTAFDAKRSAFIEKAWKVEDYEKMVNFFRTAKCHYNIVSVEPYGGAIVTKRNTDTAFVHREEAYFNIYVESFWMTNEDKSEAFKWRDDFFLSPQL